MTQAASSSALIEWQAQNIQLVAFPVSQVHPDTAKDWWTAVTGLEPEASITRKSELNISGRVQEMQLALVVEPLRTAWVLSPVLDERVLLLDALPALGSFPEKTKWFRVTLDQWLRTAPPLHRISFVTTALRRVADREEGYHFVNGHLRALDVDPSSSDLLYRINRRRNLQVSPHIAANRLATWSVGRFVHEVTSPGTPAKHEREDFACVLQLDINTAPDISLADSEIAPIFDELISLATEIVERGDAALYDHPGAPA